MPWILLTVAIVCEVAATSALKASDGFTNPWPSFFVVVGYACAFYCLSLVLRSVPVGVAYAIWAGVGIALITLVGRILFGQVLDLAAIAGIGLIVAGVVLLTAVSGSVPR